MGNNRKRKASSGKPNNNSSNNSINVLSPPLVCYEGEELARLLSSIERGLESARLADPHLAYKIWLKQQFCVGVNDVTRVLERMLPLSTDNSPLYAIEQTQRRKAPSVQLQAILVASDCIPKWLTRHLPSLACSKNVLLIHVKDKKGGSLRLGELVKLKTAIVVGVKVRGSEVNQIIEEIPRMRNGGEIKLEELL